jgi:4-amino-4-deoxy-L-arabinose transferase-like glycosyltransferase/Flp pilus assembly protein TadD
LYAVVIIFLLAFTIRIINLIVIKDNPYFESPIMDEKYHDEWAQEIATGKLFERTPFYRAPGYPYFLGLIFAIFGHGYFIPRLIGIIFGALSCALIYLIGKEIFSQKIGILAGLLACFYGMFIYFDSMLLTVYLEIFFSLIAIYWLVQWMKTQKNKHILIAGISWGLVSIVRPNFLIFVLVFAIYVLLQYKKQSIISRLKMIGLFICGILPFIITVMAVNVIAGKDMVLLAWNGGVNLYFGNNPQANGWSATSPEINATWWGGYRDAIVIAERDVGHELRPSEVSNYWFKRGFAYMFSQPLSWAKLMVKKTYIFCNSFEISNNQSLEAFRGYSLLMRIPILNYGLIFALAALGIVLSLKKKKTWLISLFIISYAFSIIIFFITARYRMPIIPFLIIFSSYTIFWIIDKIRRKDFRNAGFVSIIFIVVLIMCNLDLYGSRVVNKSLIHVSLGNRYFEKNDYKQAIAEYNKALKCDSNNIDALNALGNTCMMMGKRGEASVFYKRSLSIAPSLDALCKMGIIHSMQGMNDSAQYYLSAAIAYDSTNPEAYYYLGMHYANNRDHENAISNLERALMYFPEPQYARNIHYNLGKLYITIGEIDKARKHLLEAGINYKDVPYMLEHIK